MGMVLNESHTLPLAQYIPQVCVSLPLQKKSHYTRRLSAEKILDIGEMAINSSRPNRLMGFMVLLKKFHGKVFVYRQ